ncbi:MAG: site-specific integrase [Bacteroidetes bacterium]|nr:MAG: site-specific integrase [Bacteroidota bacterium]
MIQIRYRKLSSGMYSAFLDVYHEGQRKYDFLKIQVTKDYQKEKRIAKEDAEKMKLISSIKAKREIEIIQSPIGILPTRKLNTDNFLTYYRHIIKTQKGNHDSYVRAGNHFRDFVNTEYFPFKSLNEHLIIEFQHYLKAKSTLGHTSIYMYLQRIQIVIRHAIRDKIIHINPFDYINKKDRIARTVPDISHLDIEDITALWDSFDSINCHKHIQYGFLFSCFTGLRVSDIRLIKWSNITAERIEYIPYKTRKIKGLHYVPLSKEAKNIIEIMKEDQSEVNDYVFHGITNRGHSSINSSIRLWAAKAGIKKRVHFHVARHTFATMLLTYGTDLYTVSKLLGHSDIKMTERYGKVIDRRRDEAVLNLPEIPSNNQPKSTMQMRWGDFA